MISMYTMSTQVTFTSEVLRLIIIVGRAMIKVLAFRMPTSIPRLAMMRAVHLYLSSGTEFEDEEWSKSTLKV